MLLPVLWLLLAAAARAEVQYGWTFTGAERGVYLENGSAGAAFQTPTGIVPDGEGNAYVADSNSINTTIRKVTATGAVSDFVQIPGKAGDIVRDAAGNLYVSEPNNDLIRKITTDKVISVFAGGGPGRFSDGTGTNASFGDPTGLAVDGAGNIYVADTDSSIIRKITTLVW